MNSFSSYSDEQLVALLMQNHEPAFTEIYNRYWERLFNIAYSTLQVNESAKDVVQNVFVSLWRRRGETEIQSLKGYLEQAARFQVYNAIRAEKAHRDFQKQLTIVSKQLLDEEPLLFKELEHLFNLVIQTLPDDEREIFMLSRDHGMTYKQIAEKKSISIKTVEKKMSNVLRKIRMQLNNPMLFALFVHYLK